MATPRTLRVHARFAQRPSLARYLGKHPGSCRRWTRALAIHAREACDAASAFGETDVGPVRPNRQIGVEEYWFRVRMREKLQPIEAFVNSDRAKDSMFALREFAIYYANARGVPWLADPSRPVNLYVWWAIEYYPGDKQRRNQTDTRVVTVQPYAARLIPLIESQGSHKRNFPELEYDFDNWLGTLAWRYPLAKVHAIRTHLWCKQ